MRKALRLSRMTADPIRIVAALVVDRGQVLLVRKAGTSAFMQPGGKVEPGENRLAALQRELLEELGCAFDPTSADDLGCFLAPAAHEPGRLVEAQVFRVTLIGRASPQAEIAELMWVDPSAPGPIPLAPLTRDHVLPLAR
jgi:8-oxo-dGTP diphosphatase